MIQAGGHNPGTSFRHNQAEDFAARCLDHVRSMMRRGVPQREILNRLVIAGEQIAGPGSVVSILVLNHEGLLRNCASPNLPSDYLDAIDRLKPDPNIGTCAAAAATGAVVITPDFQDDKKWAELRHLPMALGFRSAWSVPIKSAAGRVLGTFGTYFRTLRTPQPHERQRVEELAAAAAIVLGSPELNDAITPCTSKA